MHGFGSHGSSPRLEARDAPPPLPSRLHLLTSPLQPRFSSSLVASWAWAHARMSDGCLRLIPLWCPQLTNSPRRPVTGQSLSLTRRLVHPVPGWLCGQDASSVPPGLGLTCGSARTLGVLPRRPHLRPEPAGGQMALSRQMPWLLCLELSRVLASFPAPAPHLPWPSPSALRRSVLRLDPVGPVPSA